MLPPEQVLQPQALRLPPRWRLVQQLGLQVLQPVQEQQLGLQVLQPVQVQQLGLQLQQPVPMQQVLIRALM